MRIGILRINHTDNNMKNSTIFDVTKQLRALEKVKLIEGKPESVEFASSTEGKNYMDEIANKYNSARYDEDGKIMLPNFCSVLRRLASESDGLQKLRSLGATDIDIALINKDIDAIRAAASNNEAKDPYTLAKNWKFLPFAKDEDEVSNNLYTVSISIQGQQISLPMLPYNIFEYKKLNIPTKTLLVNILDIGEDNWDYHEAKQWHESLNKYFDQVVISGNGIQCLLPNDVLHTLNSYKESKNSIDTIDFAFVIIQGHDDPEGKWKEVVGQFPKLAQQTLYLLSTCYSGQYHKNPPADVLLVTSSNAEEISDTRDYAKIVDISSYFHENKPDANSIMRFIAQNWEHSKPHFSGVIGDKNFKGVELKEALNKYSSEYQVLETSHEIKEEPANQPASSHIVTSEPELQLVNVTMLPMDQSNFNNLQALGDVLPSDSDII